LGNFSALRVLRLLRLLRVLRILRVLSFFKEFRLLCVALMSGSTWRTFLWVLLLVFMLLYMVALAMTQSALENCLGSDASVDVCARFGTLPKSFFTLFQVMYGGILWGELVDALEPIGLLPLIMLIGFVLIVNVLVANCVMAMIFKVVTDAADQLQDYRVMAQQKDRDLVFLQLMELFCEIDIDGSGSLSVGEFDLALQKPKISKIFQALKLHTHDTSELFNLLDLGGTGEVEIELFIIECMRLRGEARAVDTWKLQLSLKEIANTLDGVVSLLETTTPKGTVPMILDEEETAPDMDMSKTDAHRNHTVIHSTKINMLDLLKDSVHSGKPINRVEMRAMSLHNLRGVHMWITRMCPVQNWKDLLTGNTLLPEQVNLYHLAHYVICPVGVGDGIVLQGVKEGSFKLGQKVVQRFPNWSQGDAWAVPVAEGVVQKDSEAPLLHVLVTNGRFEFGDHPHAGDVEVDGKSFGCPMNVDAITALSYKEMISSKPLSPLWYVSHWWGEPVFDFVTCCAEHAMRWGLDEKTASYWVCGYANRQYRLQEEICDNLENSAFRRAMRLSKGTLLILDKDACPFDRIWCDFELSKTLVEPKLTLDMVTIVDGTDGNREPVLLSESNPPFESAHAKTLREECFPIGLMLKGMRCKLEEGKCTMPSDRDNILQNIMDSVPKDESLLHAASNRKAISFCATLDNESQRQKAFDQVNHAFHAYFALAVWPQAVRRGAVSKLSLPEALKSDTERTSLSLDLAQFEEFDDAGITALAGGLPSRLKHLHINFKRCWNVTDEGVLELAQSLPSQLQSLQLNFESCTQITDAGLIGLASRIGRLKCLQQLRVDFAMCSNIDIPSLRALADEMPRTVTDFAALLLGTKANCNVKSIKELRHIRRNAGALARLQRKGTD